MKLDRDEIIYLILIGIIFLMTIFTVVLNIYCFIVYGNSTIDEIPAWVLWFWWGNK